MAVTFPYLPDVELAMQVLYQSLRENDRRRYAAVEAAKLGHGGLDYLAALLGCDPKTIRRGQEDLQQLADGDLDDITPDERVERQGGGASGPPRAYRTCGRVSMPSWRTIPRVTRCASRSSGPT